MTLGIADIIALLLITIGAMNAALAYAVPSAGGIAAVRGAIEFRTIVLATIVIAIFIVVHEFIL